MSTSSLHCLGKGVAHQSESPGPFLRSRYRSIRPSGSLLTSRYGSVLGSAEVCDGKTGTDVEAILLGCTRLRVITLRIYPLLNPPLYAWERELSKLIFKTWIIRKEEVSFPFPYAGLGRGQPELTEAPAPKKIACEAARLTPMDRTKASSDSRGSSWGVAVDPDHPADADPGSRGARGLPARNRWAGPGVP